MVETLNPPFSVTLIGSMSKILFLFPLLCFLGLNDANRESFDTINLFGNAFQQQSGSGHLPLAIPVNNGDLGAISSSVLMAEGWLRTHVLAHYPATKITTIVLGDGVLCKNDQEHNLGLLIPAMKNLFLSLTRWGLEREIKVAPSFSIDCLDSFDRADKIVRPLLEFIDSKKSSIALNLPLNASPFSEETFILVSSLMESIKKLGFSEFSKVNVTLLVPNQRDHTNRKLSSIDSDFSDPFHGYTIPSNIAKHPKSHPPTSRISSPSPSPLPSAHASPPFGFELPPCNPGHVGAPEAGVVSQRWWCVAKPSVPEETLQGAMDYACGAGGGDCDEIMPNRSCFFPDTVLAHASYAFNSYWQKNKGRGGTCSFGGTAMIINSDPSFLHCRFMLS